MCSRPDHGRATVMSQSPLGTLIQLTHWLRRDHEPLAAGSRYVSLDDTTRPRHRGDLMLHKGHIWKAGAVLGLALVVAGCSSTSPSNSTAPNTYPSPRG